MENGRSDPKRKQGNVRSEGLTDPVYSKNTSQQRHGLGLRGAMHDVCDVERQAFRGGTHLLHQPTMLGQSACLQPENLGCSKGQDLVADEKEIEPKE